MSMEAMTEQKAIERLNIHLESKLAQPTREAMEKAIKALEEIQEYRELEEQGLHVKLEEMKTFHSRESINASGVVERMELRSKLWKD